MPDFLTTRQLQDLLKVDRTTIYRMVEAGSLPAARVGNQWRFEREQIEVWLQSRSGAALARAERGPLTQPAGKVEARHLFPVDCLQQIQDSFADILGLMIVLTDLEGKPITQPSNACGLFLAAESTEAGRNRCLELWVRLGQEPGLAPRFQRSHLGLLCARGMIRVGNDIRAMLVAGGVAPDDWPPTEAALARIAADLDLSPDLIHRHLHAVHRLSHDEQGRALHYVQRIADIFAHIANERDHLLGTLRRIAELSQTPPALK
jgi:excisionase family DNA binding protein